MTKKFVRCEVNAKKQGKRFHKFSRTKSIPDIVAKLSWLTFGNSTKKNNKSF